MVMTPEEVRDYCAEHQRVRGLLIVPGDAADSAEHIMPVGKWNEGELAD